MNKQTTPRINSKLSLGAFLLCSSLAACTQNQNTQRAETKASPAGAPAAHEEIFTAADSTSAETFIAPASAQVKMSANHAMARMIAPTPAVLPMHESADRYAHLESNAVVRTSEQAVSTFSLDVDTGSYAVVRRHIQHGQLPPADAVRVEEMINYFNYSYPSAKDEQHPFAFETELSTAAWHDKREVLRIALAAWQQPLEQLPSTNLVFLVDVSGSMQAADKLPLLKASLKLLTRQMREQDSISLVTYAGSSAVVLEPTKGDQQKKIIDAIDALGAGGGTHGAAGLKDAYRLAAKHKIAGGINRVLLATDGDFNVGLSNTDSLVDYISEKRQEGITLTTLGFGQGNYNDHLMEQLADKGDGNHAYIDSLSEAKKVLMEQVGATLYTVAKDAKIQVEFNPALVAEYRLIGYENRLLREQDFNDDKVDAGDVGAGHTVTALYEIARHNSGGERLAPRRYTETITPEAKHQDELAWVKLRYKARDQDKSQLLQKIVQADAVQNASLDMKFASSVAAWAEWLREPEQNDSSIEQILALAKAGKGDDKQGYRAEFIELVKLSAMMR